MSLTGGSQRITRSSKRKLEAEKKETSMMTPKSNGETYKETTSFVFNSQRLSSDAGLPAVAYINSDSQSNISTRRTMSSEHKSGKMSMTSKASDSHCIVHRKQPICHAPTVPATGNASKMGTILGKTKEAQNIPNSFSNVIKSESSRRYIGDKNVSSYFSNTSLTAPSSMCHRKKNNLKTRLKDVPIVLVRKIIIDKHIPSVSGFSVADGVSCDEARRSGLTGGTKDRLPKNSLTVNTNDDFANSDKKSLNFNNKNKCMINQLPEVESLIDITSDVSSNLPDNTTVGRLTRKVKYIRSTNTKEPICSSESEHVFASATQKNKYSSLTASTLPDFISQKAGSQLTHSDSGSRESIVREFQPKSRLCPEKSRSFIHYLSTSALGRPSFHNRKAVIDTYVKSCFSNFEVTTVSQPFCCRVTTIDWHPRVHNLISVGSKHGDLAFYSLGRKDSKLPQTVKNFAGIGPGGCITALKFHPVDNEKFYTSSLDGKVCLGNFEKDRQYGETVLLNTHCWEHWFCSLDVHQRDEMVVAGQNNGWASLMSRTGEMIWKKRLHGTRISHLEFSPHEPHLLCSASLDRSVRMWDIRMVIDKKPLDCLPHNKGLNSAYFSLTDGTRLLTTDQFDEIRVYRAPFWHLETCIKHPHRFFQYITPIKAHWHPVNDSIVCGRFPDERSYPDFGRQRAIDVFDASTGLKEYELKDATYNGIVSLCQFNKAGDKLLCAMGYNFYVWSRGACVDDELMSSKQKGGQDQHNLLHDLPKKKKDNLPKMTSTQVKKISRNSNGGDKCKKLK